MRTDKAVAGVVVMVLALAFAWSTKGLFDLDNLPYTLIAAGVAVTFVASILFNHMNGILKDAKNNVERVFIILLTWLGLLTDLTFWIAVFALGFYPLLLLLLREFQTNFTGKLYGSRGTGE